MTDKNRLKYKKYQKIMLAQNNIRNFSLNNSCLYASEYIKFYGDNKFVNIHMEMQGLIIFIINETT